MCLFFAFPLRRVIGKYRKTDNSFSDSSSREKDRRPSWRNRAQTRRIYYSGSSSESDLNQGSTRRDSRNLSTSGLSAQGLKGPKMPSKVIDLRYKGGAKLRPILNLVQCSSDSDNSAEYANK